MYIFGNESYLNDSFNWLDFGQLVKFCLFVYLLFYKYYFYIIFVFVFMFQK